MKLPIRLENAITKLYTAFHEGTLNAMDCRACAVGNLCDNKEEWTGDAFYKWGEAIRINKKFKNNSGYSFTELAIIECLFLYGKKHEDEPTVFKNTLNELQFKNNPELQKQNTELQFKGLCAVVEYICELDNIQNVMDYTKLFETENNEPKYQLINQLN